MHLAHTWRAPRIVIAGALVSALTGSGLIVAANTQAAEVILPNKNSVSITTAGWGHARGMSQYGAGEAAKQGRNATQILSFYYPGTTMERLDSDDTIRVWIKDDTDGDLKVKPAAGLTVRDSAGAIFKLPTGTQYTQWRITKTDSLKRVLSYKDAASKWVDYPTSLDDTLNWIFANPTSNTVSVVLPSATRTYRGTVAMRVQGGQKITVNTVKMEEYLRSVVPSEMPASWKIEAVKAQAVAARSYSARYRANLGGKKYYDVCDTTSCQVYKGTANEHANSDAAIKATAGQVLTYKGQYAWTEFSSSNGGYSKAGDAPYLVAKADPYDLAAKQLHTVTISSATLDSKYKIGTLKSISLKRDGLGQFGGRVTSVTLTGSKATKTVTGAAFKSALGLRETMFKIVGAPSASTGSASDTGQTTGTSDNPNEVILPPASIAKTSISSATVKNTTWSGKALKPAVSVKSGSKKLKLNTDYSLAYSSNTSVGIGKVVVKGKGSYAGTKTLTFTIAPKNTKVKSVTAGKKQIKIKWAKVSSKQKASGYRISYRVKGKGAWITKSVSASKSSLTIKKLRKKLKYEVKIATYKKISGKTYTSGLSAAKTSKPVK